MDFAMNNLREFLIWTLVVPALLLSLSVWQGFRAVGSMEREARYRAELAEDIPALQEMLATYPDAVIRYKKSGVKQSAAKALEEALKGQQRMERNAGQREISLGVAGLGAASSLAVMLAGLVGLWGIREVRRASMRSRAALVQSFSCWQDRLAVVLCVLAGGLCCAVASAVGFEFWDVELQKSFKAVDMAGMVKVGIFLFAVFGMGVYAVCKLWKAWRDLFVPGVGELHGQRITPEDSPALWELVRGVAQLAGAEPPDTIVLGMNPTFFVRAGDVELYPEGAYCHGTLLYLGLPFMAYLSRRELASVVAHELGHYAGEDLDYSRRFLPIYVRTHRQLTALQDVETEMESPLSKLALEPATMLARNFFDALDAGVKFWSRQRELAADEVSAAVVGPRTAAVTLLRVVALSPALDAALDQWAEIPADDDEADVDLDDELTDNPVDKSAEEATEEATAEPAAEGYGEDNDEGNDEDNDEDTEPDAPAEAVNLVHLAAGPHGVLTFVQRAVQEQGELADPRDALEEAVPHPLDTHPLTAQRLQAWGVKVDDALLREARRFEESPLLQELGLLPHGAPKERTEDSPR